MPDLNISMPKGWGELSQEQLRFLLSTIIAVNGENRDIPYESKDDYALQTAAQVQTICFFRWGGMSVVTPYADGYIVAIGDTEFFLTIDTVTAVIAHLDWIKEPPLDPVRLDTVDGADAIPADISSGLSFDSWLACETMWLRYQTQPDDCFLRQMAAILYNKEDIDPDPVATLGIFYWWAGVKNLVSAMFPNFFKPADGGSDDAPPSYDEMRRNIDAQIRALTKGDITKERDILSMNAIRALTELDALAREYDDLHKKYGNK